MIIVTCAVIRNEDDEILVVQRGGATDHPFKWEFPGGKLHSGETEEECIIREIDEELSMEIIVVGRLTEIVHDYGHKQIRLIPFICDTLDELPFLSEHIAYRWIAAGDLLSVDFSEADVFAAKDYLKSFSSDTDHITSKSNKSDEMSSDDAELQAMVVRIMGMKEAEWVATSAVENPALFKKLLEYSFSDDSKLAFHSSWTLSKACEKYPEMIYPFLPQIIDRLDNLEYESVQRSILRILSFSDFSKINEKYHGILADYSFGILRSGFSSIANKAYSMEILYKLVLRYPELRNELFATLSLLQTEGSAGIVARARMIMKKLSLE